MPQVLMEKLNNDVFNISFAATTWRDMRLKFKYIHANMLIGTA